MFRSAIYSRQGMEGRDFLPFRPVEEGLVDDFCKFDIISNNSEELWCPSGRPQKNDTFYLRKREACIAGPVKNDPKSPEILDIMSKSQKSSTSWGLGSHLSQLATDFESYVGGEYSEMLHFTPDMQDESSCLSWRLMAGRV